MRNVGDGWFWPKPFQKWVRLGRTLSEVDTSKALGWVPAQRLDTACRSFAREEATRLRTLLNKSRERFKPLDDPLAVDLREHRWLQGAREEVYSDWLQWILMQIDRPEYVYRVLLGEFPPRGGNGPLEVMREGQSQTLNDGEKRRRTDLEIRFGCERAILVEVKKGDAGEVDPQQLKDLAKQKSGFTHYILLVKSPESGTKLEEFRIRSWKDVCLELRKLVPELKKKNLNTAGLILGFIGSVEQNILEFSGGLRTHTNSQSIIDSRVIEYLQGWLNTGGIENAKG